MSNTSTTVEPYPFINAFCITGYGGAASERQQRDDYSDAGLYIEEPPITDVESQIDITNKMFQEKTLMICDDCTLTINQLENCVRDEKEQIADKSTWHHLDETRYFATGVKEDSGIEIIRLS